MKALKDALTTRLMSPSNALIYVENIKNALLNTIRKMLILIKNAAAYAKKSNNSINLYAKNSQIPSDQRWLVTSEGAFSYLEGGLRSLKRRLFMAN